MNFEKLNQLLQNIISHPKIKKDWESYQGSSRFTELAGKLVGGLETLMLFGFALGRKRLIRMNAAVGTLILLIKVSVYLKERVIDDPKTKKWLSEAWDELGKQSFFISTLARQTANQFGRWRR